MNDLLELMWAPFLACLLLSGMHAYLGIHVLLRGVIFVDLALAQIAACGATLGAAVGWGLHSIGSYLCSLTATLCGAALLAYSRPRDTRVPHEAFIGIIYVVAAALAVLILSRAPEGGEELKSLLVGHLLFVTPLELFKLAAVYGIIGALHYRFRRTVFAVSRDPAAAANQGSDVRRWDLFFYATFGVVVTSSTELAGVLLVFSFLVVPAVTALLFGRSDRARVLIAWVVGASCSALGVSASYLLDLPTGAAVVCTFGAMLILLLMFGRRCIVRG